jgi:hypothetical protein
VKLKLKPAGHFDFSAKGAYDLPYELDLELFDARKSICIRKLIVDYRHPSWKAPLKCSYFMGYCRWQWQRGS